MKLLAAALALLLACTAAAQDDCLTIPGEPVGREIVVELAPGSDFGAFLTRWDCHEVDWIPEIWVGVVEPNDVLVDVAALIDSMRDRDNRGDLAAGDPFECDHAEPVFDVENPEGVQEAIGDLLPVINRSQFTQQPAALLARVPDEATATWTGAGVTVAVLDTGLATMSAELAGVLTGDGVSVRDGETSAVVPANGVDDDGDGATDESAGHGSHVAGLVHLVAPEASILPIRVLNDEGRGTSMDVAHGIVAAVAAGADIINFSLGLPADTRAVEAAVEYAAMKGVTMVASAGNRGIRCVEAPARIPPVIGVAAVDQSFVKPAWASHGLEVALSAPATGTVSTHDDVSWTEWDGSSFAAPMVAGAVALLKQRYPGLKPADLRETVQLLVQPDANGPELAGLMGTGVLDLQRIGEVPIAQLVTVGREGASARLTWGEVPGGVSIDVGRGLVSALRLGDEIVELGNVTCLADDAPTGTVVLDPDSPPPGDVFFYVLRSNPPGQEGSWGVSSLHVPRVPQSTACSP
jgi:subtilisin family serine protease